MDLIILESYMTQLNVSDVKLSLAKQDELTRWNDNGHKRSMIMVEEVYH